MSALAALAAAIICLVAYALSRKEAEFHRSNGNDRAIVCYLRAAFQLGATCAFGMAALWAWVLS